jgi:uncharacterized protein YndB with AHSA1/START domain
MSEAKPLEIEARIQVSRSAEEVFEAIADPEKMCNYFISAGSGRMEEGQTLKWRFPEFDMAFPVRVDRVTRPSFISFRWDGQATELQVEITLQAIGNHATVVKVTEKSMPNNEAGILWLRQNTEGWANFLACLKAWLEYGINLRKGAFDFMKAG